jgi:hypothetical protein
LSIDVAVLANLDIDAISRYAYPPPRVVVTLDQMPNAENIASTRWTNSRRSQRVVLRFPVIVRATVKDHESFVETTHTLVVNGHGALIALATKVHLKQKLLIENLGTGKLQQCHVVHVGERQRDTNEIGIEFEGAAPNFWNIAFPPTDWKPMAD